MRATLIATELLATTAVAIALVATASVAKVLLAGCGGYLAYEPADLEAPVAPVRYLNRSSDDSSLAALVRASGYAGEWPPDPWRLDTLTLTAQRIEVPARTVTLHLFADPCEESESLKISGVRYGHR